MVVFPIEGGASTGFESWAKESFEIATNIAYRNDGRIGTPKGGNKDCTMVATASRLHQDLYRYSRHFTL